MWFRGGEFSHICFPMCGRTPDASIRRVPHGSRTHGDSLLQRAYLFISFRGWGQKRIDFFLVFSSILAVDFHRKSKDDSFALIYSCKWLTLFLCCSTVRKCLVFLISQGTPVGNSVYFLKHMGCNSIKKKKLCFPQTADQVYVFGISANSIRQRLNQYFHEFQTCPFSNLFCHNFCDHFIAILILFCCYICFL